MDFVGTSTTTRGLFSTNDTTIQMRIYSDKSNTSNYRAIQLKSTANLENSLCLYSRVDGTSASYNIWNKYNLSFSLSGTTLTITTK